MWFDTHCHLDADEFAADRDEVVARLTEKGVSRVLVPAVSVDTIATVDACCARYPAGLPAYANH